ncbi:MAG: universal stress protein [Candidatus Schekmanbacteria bacterium]|nr:MAG: universal stress protein [Candidatus Schekmanbacteria bacterium]
MNILVIIFKLRWFHSFKINNLIYKGLKMFKNILIPLDRSPYSDICLKYAIWLAKQFKAKLFGQHVVDLVALEGPIVHDISGAMGFEPYVNLSDKMKEVLSSRGSEILEEFAEKCRDNGIPYETYLDTGIVSNEICSRAKTADIIVLAQKGLNAKFDKGLLGSISDAVIRKSQKPIFLTPAEYREIKRILLCFDGSNYASLAMQTAAEFAIAIGAEMHILTVGKDEDEGKKKLEEAKKYLDSYEIKAIFSFIEGNAHEVIVEFSEKEEIDLVFMGAYGHSRIIEMVLGSTTEYVLRNIKCPVIIRR